VRLFALGDPRSPVLSAYIASRARVSLIDGPLGSGKTTASCQRILLHMLEQPPNRYAVRPSRGLVVRNTYPDLLSTTAETFRAFFFREEASGEEPVDPVGEERLPPLGRWYGGGEEPPQAVFDFLRDDDGTRVACQVLFMALDRPADVRRLLGSEFTWIYLSECKEIDKAVLDMLTKRHGRYPSLAQGEVECGWHGILGDTNKPARGSWYYEAAEVTRPEGWAFFHQPGGVLEDPRGRDGMGRKRWIANPKAENLHNLKPGYYTNDLATYRDDWITVFLANEYGYVSTGKPVHPDYVDHVHCAPQALEAIAHLPLVLGFDFGRTPACAVVQWWPGAGRWAALAEYVTKDQSAVGFAPDVKAWLGRTYPEHVRDGLIVRGWGDPAGDDAGQATDDTPIQILRSYGIPCESAPTNDPLLRRSALANPLRRGTMDGGRGFILSPACETLRQGLQGGWCFERINRIGEERYHDRPAKNWFSHVCEALEYALAGEGEAEQAIQPASTRYGRGGDVGQEYAEM
jgi:hypothetical protein